LGGVRVRATGLENIPAGVCIFVANHTSNIDPPAVAGVIPRRVALLAKKEVFRVPVLAQALQRAQFIPVDRADRGAAMESVEAALQNLRAGVSYLIFPEGTRSPDGRLRPFKKGSFVMAIRAGMPVVPVAVVGAHKLMSKGSVALRAGEVEVRFGAPVDSRGLALERRDQLVGRVQAAVAAMLPAEQLPLTPGSAP
jgi:1-acyl-sn-glycerol-3-phosphate acyltransferase